jgi:spermidine/putrescine-binding protein
MKKIVLSFTVLVSLLVLAACGDSRETLYVLNWGEYMDEDLIDAFEAEFNVRVIYDEEGSNEAMEVRILTGTTPYDVVIPSDYMIDKLRQNNLLNPIDRSLLPALADISFIPEALALYEDSPIYTYMIPYFWGTIGIIYNTRNSAVVEAVETQGFGALFDPNSPFRRGMYDSPRDAVAAALLHLGFDVNTTDEAQLTQAEALLSAANFNVFGEDTLKGLVAEGSLDMALVYSGDFFDIEYAFYEDDLEINFDFYAPQKTNVWIDGFVIPTTSQNV